MPYLDFTCTECGKRQNRWQNARKCVECGGTLELGSNPKLEAKKKVQQLREQIAVMERERDKFRALLSDWMAILESWDEAIDGDLELATQYLDNAADRFSEHI